MEESQKLKGINRWEMKKRASSLAEQCLYEEAVIKGFGAYGRSFHLERRQRWDVTF